MINVKNEIKKELVNALVAPDPESRQLFLKSIKNESGEGTQNSRGMHGWDFRYNSIIEIAKRFNLKHIKLRRKLWEAVLLLGPENEVFVFFTEANLKRIIRHGNGNHYLKLLNLFNEEHDTMEPIDFQLNLFVEEDDGENEDLINQAREMLHMMEADPSKVIVFAFSNSFVSTVKAYSFNTKHQLVWEENLTEHIDVNYHSVLKDDNIEPENRKSSVTTTTKEKKRIVKLKG